jgi:hypothetical protein
VDVPVAIHCRCGNSIILEARWIGKPSACAKCQADFVVTMLMDPATKRLVPHVQYTPTYMPENVQRRADGTAIWANVTCECGVKIGLDHRFLGKHMTCSGCKRPFIVRMAPRSSRDGETAIMEFTPEEREYLATPPSRRSSPPAGRATEPAGKKPSIMDLARSAPPPRKGLPPPPDEMHLLCTCGEQLTVAVHFYNRNMYCSGCGSLMHLRLEYNEGRAKYELLARVLDRTKREGRA